MEDDLGAFFLHLVTFQRNVFDPAALGEEQVRPWRQRVNIGPRGGSNNWRPPIIMDTCMKWSVCL